MCVLIVLNTKKVLLKYIISSFINFILYSNKILVLCVATFLHIVSVQQKGAKWFSMSKVEETEIEFRTFDKPKISLWFYKTND